MQVENNSLMPHLADFDAALYLVVVDWFDSTKRFSDKR